MSVAPFYSPSSAAEKTQHAKKGGHKNSKRCSNNRDTEKESRWGHCFKAKATEQRGGRESVEKLAIHSIQPSSAFPWQPRI